MPAKAHAARNLPTTADVTEIGKVIKSSIVPLFCSSAHSRIEMAGNRKR